MCDERCTEFFKGEACCAFGERVVRMRSRKGDRATRHPVPGYMLTRVANAFVHCYTAEIHDFTGRKHSCKYLHGQDTRSHCSQTPAGIHASTVATCIYIFIRPGYMLPGVANTHVHIYPAGIHAHTVGKHLCT
eukprot:1358660-Amorphochlora_amoeboformis.AAC.1